MKNVLIFSACLMLVLLLRGMPKTDIREFDEPANSQQVKIEVEISRVCFADSLISGLDSINDERLNSILMSLITTKKKNNLYNFSPWFYVPQMVGWASWIGLSYRRRQPYRNPLRRFRLNKKQRRRLLKHLSTRLPAQNDVLSDSLSSMEEV